MLELIAAILALGVGPLLDRFSHSRGPTRAALDAFTFVAMLGLILGHIVPDAYELAGPWSLLVVVAAWFGPTVFESRVRSMAARAHFVAMLLGALGLVVHGAFDGMALVNLPGEDDHALSLAVILHRIPAGLTIWWLVVPRWGEKKALFTLLGLALTTICGYAFATHLAGNVNASQAGYFQALVGGALLHVIVHRTGHGDMSERAHRRKSGAFIGTLLAAALLFWMFSEGEHVHVGIEGEGHAHAISGHEDHDHAGHDHAGHHHHDHGAHEDAPAQREFWAGGLVDYYNRPPETFLGRLLRLAGESAPALVLAFFMAGLIQIFLPKSSVAWLSRGNRVSRSLKGVAFGLPLPICSCGVVPIYKSLVNRGVPAAAGLSFLIATPELGVDAILLSMPLLGTEMTILRVVAAAIVALLVGILVSRLNKGLELESPADLEDDEVEGSRFWGAMRSGWVDFFDATFPWILLELVVAAICEPLLAEDVFAGYSSFLQVPFFALVGMPVYVCASGATPLVAIFLAKGVSPGAALAFLLTGPATNVTTFGLLQRLHGKKLALGFVTVVITTTISLGLITDHFFAASFEDAGLTSEHTHPTSTLEALALLVLFIAFVASIYRQGPQAFAAHIISQADEGGHDHDHDHDHDHGGHDEPKKSCCH